MPRSMRLISVKPQLWAMSVAFEAQGEIVPRRGVTNAKLPLGSAGRVAGMPSRSLSRASSSPLSVPSVSTTVLGGAGGAELFLQTGETGGGKGGGAAELEDRGHGGDGKMAGRGRGRNEAAIILAAFPPTARPDGDFR